MTTFRSRKEIEALHYTGEDDSVLEVLRLLREHTVDGAWKPDWSGRIEFGNKRLMAGDWLQWNSDDQEFVIWGDATLHEMYEAL